MNFQPYSLYEIHKLVPRNPRQPGSWGYQAWEALEDGMTVDQYLEATQDFNKEGGKRNSKHLNWDFERGWVKLVHPTSGEEVLPPAHEALRLVLLTDRREIARAQENLQGHFKNGATKQGAVSLGFQGGRIDGAASWRADLGIWAVFRELEDRYWNAFGTVDPFEGSPSIVVEINPPQEGSTRRLGGAFARDSEGGVFLVHRGKVGGGRKGVGKTAFMDSLPGKKALVVHEGKSDPVVVVGSLDSVEFLEELASFVRSVERFKEQATTTDRVACWWVNQGKTYSAERDNGYIWAPAKTKAGASLGHHKAVGHTKVGDVVVHYSGGRIVALGTVTASPKSADRPDELPEAEWTRAGMLAEVRYFELDDPIELSEINLHDRLEEGGPFHRDGAIKQGYLFPLGDEFAAGLRETFAGRWPNESPWESHDNNSLHMLFKWSADLQPETIEVHREIADLKGSVWWGRISDRPTGDKKIRRIKEQLSGEVPTFAFLYKSGGDDLWRAGVIDITDDPTEVDGSDLPSYYEKEECSLLVRLGDFKRLDSDYPLRSLVLDSSPSDPARMRGALRNQTSPLWVRMIQPSSPGSATKSVTLDMAWLAEQTLWDHSKLVELIETLTSDSPQVVLAGPPGTGKTWVAQHVARYLVNDDRARFRMVQFHPSFGYEEFIEGLRPVSAMGGIKFEVVPGVVLEMSDGMRAGDEKVLVIDEMNRANLPRVFGELMYLFEYRDERISLQYTSDFSLPSGLKFIGTP